MSNDITIDNVVKAIGDVAVVCESSVLEYPYWAMDIITRALDKIMIEGA